MKRDMGGAAAILAAFQAAVKAQMSAAAAAGDGGGARRSRPLHALLCLAENSVAANATRPDDVHTLYSGRTVRKERDSVRTAGGGGGGAISGILGD